MDVRPAPAEFMCGVLYVQYEPLPASRRSGRCLSPAFVGSRPHRTRRVIANCLGKYGRTCTLGTVLYSSRGALTVLALRASWSQARNNGALRAINWTPVRRPAVRRPRSEDAPSTIPVQEGARGACAGVSRGGEGVAGRPKSSAGRHRKGWGWARCPLADASSGAQRGRGASFPRARRTTGAGMAGYQNAGCQSGGVQFLHNVRSTSTARASAPSCARARAGGRLD